MELVKHLVLPLVDHPDDVSLQAIEGDNVTMLEMIVNEADKPAVEGEKGRTLRAVRNIVSAAAGRRKTTLDLVDEHAEEDAEE